MLDSLLVFKNKGEDGAIPLNAENVNYNFNLIKQLLNVFHPIGEYFETSDVNFDPNVSWGGTWEKIEDGTVLASRSNVSGSKFNVDVGTIIGEENHTLTINEMPKHRHGLYYGNAGDGSDWAIGLNWNSSAGKRTDGGTGQGIDYSGESKPHNNIQPTKICVIWHRTA